MLGCATLRLAVASSAGACLGEAAAVASESALLLSFASALEATGAAERWIAVGIAELTGKLAGWLDLSRDGALPKFDGPMTCRVRHLI